MISVPWPLRLAPPLVPAPLLALPEPPLERSPELPDPLEPDAPERDCSLLVDSRDWAIDHSFFQNWERPGGRPTVRSSSLVQHGGASRRRNDLLRPISHKPCPSIMRSDFLFTRSAPIAAPASLNGVRTRVARPVHDESASRREPLRACRRCSIARSPGFPLPSPGPPPPR